jgi:hypothetical protein
LLDELTNYKKENISSKAIALLEKEVYSNPDFTYEKAENGAYALKFL